MKRLQLFCTALLVLVCCTSLAFGQSARVADWATIQSLRLDRDGPFAIEVAAAKAKYAQLQSVLSGATVTTDKSDYQPGDVVTITGQGWSPGETVTLKLLDSQDGYHPLTPATASGAGEIYNNEFLITTDHLGLTFYLTAIGRTSGDTAMATFTDAEKINLDQVRNGTAASPTNPGDFQNGNVGGSQGHYFEGHSLPYRATMTGMPTSTTISVIIEYDITESSGAAAHAQDYDTDYDRINDPAHTNFSPSHPAETIDPTLNTGFTTAAGTAYVKGSPTSTFNIPTPPTVTAGTVLAQFPPTGTLVPQSGRFMTLWGGTISSITQVAFGDTALSDSKAQLRVTFSLSNSEAILAWGGHISRQQDWGVGGSATSVSGSPYHHRLISWGINTTGAQDGSLPNLGNTDRSMAAAAVFAPCIPPGVGATGGTLTCTTTSVVLSASSTTAGTFSWAPAGGIVSGGTTANPRVSASGTYTVTVSITANGGCSSTATAFVDQNTTAPGASATGGTLTCTTTSITLTGSTNAGTSYSWARSGGGGIISGGTSLNPLVSSSGTYTLTVTNSSNGCTSTATAFVGQNTTAPGASATGGTLTCTTTSITLTGSTTNGNQYSWSPGAGIVSGGTTLSPVVSSSGTYTLTVTNSNNGCTSTATAFVGQNTTPPGASATGGTLTCTTTSITLTGSTTNGNQYSWSPGGGIVSGGNTLSPVVSSSGTYTLTVTNSNNGCTSTATAFVGFNGDSPGASATGGTITCTTTSITLTGSTDTGTNYSWARSGGGGIISGGTSLNPLVSSSGTYTLTVTNSNNGCISTATAFVDQNTTAPGASATGGTLTCTTTQITLTGSTNTGTSYSWARSGGGGIISGGTSLNPLVSSSGTYTLTVSNSNNGCTSTATAFVDQNTTAPGASATGGTLTCTTTSITLTGSTTNGNQYSWSPGGGIVSGGNTLSPVVSASGTYTLSVTNSNNGCTSTATAFVGFDGTPPGASATGGTLTCTTTSITLTGSTNTGTNYSWAPGAGIVSGGTTLSPVVSASGTYTLTVTNSNNGCISTATAFVGFDGTPPGASATGGTLTCTTTSITLTGATTNGNQYSWSPGAGIVSGGTTLSPVVSASGTYTLTVTNSNNGCTSTATAFVDQNTTAPGASATGGTITCPETSITLTGTTTTGTDFSWSGPGIVSGSNTLSPVVSATGTYTLSVTNSANGCTSTATAPVDFVVCADTFCTVTQGYWGNPGGTKTVDGVTHGTLEWLQILIGPPYGNLTIGIVGVRSLTIPDGKEQCVIDLLPTGGKPSVLPNYGDQTVGTSPNCGSTLTGFTFFNDGRLKNVAIGQVITMALNLRLDPSFASWTFPDDTICTQALDNPADVKKFVFPSWVVGLSPQQILLMADSALANLPPTGRTIGDLAGVAGLFNEAFDECRILTSCTIDGASVRGIDDIMAAEAVEEKFIPTEFGLFQSYPNPFNPTATIRFDIPTASVVTLKVYNILGQEVATLVNGESREAGRYEVQFDGSRVGSGVYFYRITAGSFNSLKKMVLIK